jgi:hypothetical protein
MKTVSGPTSGIKNEKLTLDELTQPKTNRN